MKIFFANLYDNTTRRNSQHHYVFRQGTGRCYATRIDTSGGHRYYSGKSSLLKRKKTPLVSAALPVEQGQHMRYYFIGMQGFRLHTDTGTYSQLAWKSEPPARVKLPFTGAPGCSFRKG